MNRIVLPAERLRQALSYDAGTGQLMWRIDLGRKIRAGRPAGHLNRKGYLEVRIDGTTYQGHRVAWLLGTGTDPGSMYLDHINGNRSDNRLLNLRLASAAQNAQNSRRSNTPKASQYKGVTWYTRKAKWAAQIRCGGKSTWLGYYDSELEAHHAYVRAAIQLHGEFARLT